MGSTENTQAKLYRKVVYSFWGLNLFFIFVLGLALFIPIFSTEQESLEVNPIRGVASIKSISSSAEAALNMADVDMLTIDLECLEDGSVMKIKTSAKQVRLRGKWCNKVDKEAVAQIKNRSGGYEATLFPLKDKSFTSDYITLIKGDNRIIFTLEKPDGSALLSELFLNY